MHLFNRSTVRICYHIFITFNSNPKFDYTTHRLGKAHLVAKMPMGGITSIAFAGNNGEELYALVASKITNFSTGKDVSYQSPGTSLYRVKGLGRGSPSKRYIA